MNTFRALRALFRTMQKTEWRIGTDQEIRVDYGKAYDVCPLAFVATVATGQQYTTHGYRAAGEALGFDTNLTRMVAFAADNTTKGGKSQKIRKLMKKAVGL